MQERGHFYLALTRQRLCIAQGRCQCYLGNTQLKRSIEISTTTIKLPDALKSRIANAAAAAGKTPHAFMLESLQAQIELVERRRQFVDQALLAREEVAQYGLIYDADEVFSYIQARLAGKQIKRPSPTQL